MPQPVVQPVVQRLGIPGLLDAPTHPARLHGPEGSRSHALTVG